ncbi:hypothetical protein CFC21_009511 [Triticum aestivum]|uniref:F-box domain-containing protein n=3 Tax=Triticum TaxID=4564 RepID=A0A9R0R868_TRITD|nr:F-box/FBD/LRR-repeat protein At4g00160-like [Triticum aestivum]KAF6992528.1 hypothetical protein CFC21_009511 [Triticum aestivum]VAH23943.1 unnamed protein product [Triticum turgidum subsp. durum]
MDAPPPPWRYRKKRKFERVHDQESPLAGGLDLINALPDAVLCTIISLLPTKEGARTQAVARRWRPLWRSAPLNLVADFSLSWKERRRVALISKVLAEHPGPALLLELPDIRQRDHHKLDGWLRSQALTGLQILYLGYSADDDKHGLLPPPALRFAPTLRVATFRRCHFPDLSGQSLNFPCLNKLSLYKVAISALPAHSLNFPHLKQLTICEVTISGDSLHNMLSGCHSLESLFLEGILGAARLCISSATLRSIGFSAIRRRVWGWECDWDFADLLQELVIEDAPCLERLLPLYPGSGPETVRVIQAPKLQVLDVLSSQIFKLFIGTTVSQKMIPISVTTTMPTVKVLAIEFDDPNLDALIGLLNCFPCLERLYVIFDAWSRMKMKSVQKYDPLDPIECLESYLKRVVLEGYSGDMPNVEFAKFFVLNAKVLEEMKFGSIHSRDREWKSNQHMWLQVDSRASRGARFEFTSRYCRHNGLGNSHTHDLSMANPFKCFDAACKLGIQECLFCNPK